MNIVLKYFTKIGAHNVKFMIEPNKAAPGSSIATLGQKQVNMKQFCDAYNKASLEFLENVKKKYQSAKIFSMIKHEDLLKSKMAIRMRIYDAKNWEIRIKNTSVSSLIKMIIKLEKGCSTPGKSTVSSIKKSDLIEIARFKISEMNARSLEAAVKIVSGTAYSMGVSVINDVDKII
jgi:large subunit ribosomal protein L11